MKQLVTACRPHAVMVSLSSDNCSAWLMLLAGSKFQWNVDLSAHCSSVHWLYDKSRSTVRGQLLIAREICNRRGIVGGTMRYLDVPVVPGASSEGLE